MLALVFIKIIIIDFCDKLWYTLFVSHRRTVHRSVGDRRIGNNHAGRLSDKMSSELGNTLFCVAEFFVF